MTDRAPDCPLPVIGRVRTPYAERELVPLQSSANRTVEGVVEVDSPYRPGLRGLDGFSHAWLLTWLDRPADHYQPAPVVQVPFLLRPEGREVGTFAMRGPRRVNPIGLSLVRLLAVDEAEVRFAGVDLLDGTPVVDLKPYVARFDMPDGRVRSGWFDEVDVPDGIRPADLPPPR